MITLAWYLLKVIIASGILCGYYFSALRNKIFHRWNRFYLLASVIIALAMPLLKINIFQHESEHKSTMVTMLQTINAGDEAVNVYEHNNTTPVTLQNAGWFLYLFVSCFFLIVFFITLHKISRLRKKYPSTLLHDIHFYSTDARDTPFSFFKSIFWNINIDVHSRAGQQIFNHEIAHIQEKHSYDKIAMNIILVFFWINPFFWLMRKELNMIHEFIADKKAVEDSDLSSFAEMILHTVYPSQNFTLTNNFFYSPLKRRILMLTKNNNPKVNYFSRLMVLPIAAILFFGFTIHVKNRNTNVLQNKRSFAYNTKNITVVIDAGHGGSDFGAISADGLKEKDINLAIAKKIKDLNSNDQIKIILSRSDDRFMNPKERIEFVENNHPDLFISIHVNADKDHSNEKGFSVLIDKNNGDKNVELASALINELQKIYSTQTAVGVRTKCVWVLDHNICPATLIECGYLTNEEDVQFITNTNNQEKIARNILNAINDYSATEENTSGILQKENSTADTTPAPTYNKKKVREIRVTHASSKVNITYEDGTTETITETEARRNGLLTPPPPPPPVVDLPAPPPPPAKPGDAKLLPPPPPPPIPSGVLYIIDGNKSTKTEAGRIDKTDIKSINVLKGSVALNKYGNEAKNGAVEITTVKPLVFVNGNEMSQDEMKKIDPSSIESINVLKDTSAEKIYGSKGKNGVIEIQLKNDTTHSKSLPD